MLYQNVSEIVLRNQEYVPIIKDHITYYGGNQMWFQSSNKTSTDYILHHYGSGTIAIADLFLYLGIKSNIYKNQVTESALQGKTLVSYIDYMSYIRTINSLYIKSKPYIDMLGRRIARAFNSHSRRYQLGLKAKWELRLSYYEMLELIEEMLYYDVPIILSIGPNTPNLWGKKGITFYHGHILDESLATTNYNLYILPTQYKFRPARNNIKSHYVTVTGIHRMEDTNSKGIIMLQISSWGKVYYINYEEYRDYVDCYGGTFTSSILYIK